MQSTRCFIFMASGKLLFCGKSLFRLFLLVPHFNVETILNCYVFMLSNGTRYRHFLHFVRSSSFKTRKNTLWWQWYVKHFEINLICKYNSYSCTLMLHQNMIRAKLCVFTLFKLSKTDLRNFVYNFKTISKDTLTFIPN